MAFAAAHAGEPPDPDACANYKVIKTGNDAACDAAIAAETNPAEKSVLLYRRAYIIIDRQDFRTYPKAQDDLTEAIRLLPTNYFALRERAYLYNEYGRWADALKDIDAGIALKPQEFGGYQERSMTDLNLGNLAAYYDDNNTLVLLQPKKVSVLIMRAVAATWLGRFDDAKRDLDTAAAQSPTDDEKDQIAAERDDISIMQHRSNQGASACTDAGAADPGQKPTFVGDCTEAFLKAGDAKTKADALTLRSLGWMAVSSDWSARQDSIVAAGLAPGNGAMHSNLGFAWSRSGDYTAATREFDRSIALKPTAITYAGRGAAKLGLHNNDGAFADGKKSFEIKPNALALWVVGDAVFERSKSYDEAKSFWIGAWRLGSRDDRLIQRLKDAGVPIPPPDDPKQ